MKMSKEEQRLENAAFELISALDELIAALRVRAYKRYLAKVARGT